MKLADEIAPIIKGMTGYVEYNGLGKGLFDILKNKRLNVKKFLTTNKSKQDLVTETLRALSEGTLVLPTLNLCPKLDNEMSMYISTRTSTGLLAYSHTKGMHDDYVDSLMMAKKAQLIKGYSISF